MHRLQYSGYDKEDRIKVYRKAKNKFSKRQTNENEGKEPMYRSKFWNLERRKSEKEGGQNEWYKKGGFKSTLFIEATPKEELARKCQSILKQCGLPIKVIQKSGKSIKQHLVKSNPFKDTKCTDEECPICMSNNGTNCKTREVVYRHECADYENCEGKYIGETSDSIKERTVEHIKSCELKRKESAHYKHNMDKHNGEIRPFEVRVIAKCQNDPMLRQCIEALMIKDENPNMNFREEWGNRKKQGLRKTSNALS